MSMRKQVYAEEYLAAHNKGLNHHPRYRDDMKFTQVFINGDLVMETRDKVISQEDIQVFEDACKTVGGNYELIIP